MKMTKGIHPFAHDVEIIYLDNTFLLVYVTKSLGIFSSNGTSCIHTFVIACVLYPTRQSPSIIHKYRVYHINASPFCFALLKMSPHLLVAAKPRRLWVTMSGCGVPYIILEKKAFHELVSSNIVFTMHRGGIYPFLTSPFATEAIIVNPLDEK